MANFAIAEFTTAEWSVLIPGLVVMVVVSVWLSVIDWREHRLPNNIVVPLAAAAAVWVFALGFVIGDGGRSVTAIVTGFGAVGIFFVLNLVAGVGMGDVKYAFPVFATLGWFGSSSVSTGVLAMLLSAGVVAAIVLLQGKGAKHRVAFGPYMAFGLFCGIVVGLIG